MIQRIIRFFRLWGEEKNRFPGVHRQNFLFDALGGKPSAAHHLLQGVSVVKTVDNGDLFDLIGQGAQQLLQMAFRLLGGHTMQIGGDLFGFHMLPFEKSPEKAKNVMKWGFITLRLS